MSLSKNIEDECYDPDGTMRESHQKFLKQMGRTDEEIRQREQRKKKEIEMERLIAAHNPQVTRQDLIVERQGLSDEEALSQGFISVEDLE